MQMPSPFDPELASRLLAKAGVNVSAAELRARASPTAPRRSDMRLELPRGGAASETGSSICGGDDPEDLSLTVHNLRYGSPTPTTNSVITKSTGNVNSNGKNSTSSAIAAKSFDTMHGSREPNMAPLHPSVHHAAHNSAITGTAILDTYLQLIAESSNLTTMGLTPEQVAAMANVTKVVQQMSVMDKRDLARTLDDYPVICRDEGRESGIHENRHDTRDAHERHSELTDDVDSSGGEEELSENDEPEVGKNE